MASSVSFCGSSRRCVVVVVVVEVVVPLASSKVIMSSEKARSRSAISHVLFQKGAHTGGRGWIGPLGRNDIGRQFFAIPTPFGSNGEHDAAQ
eukprot:scaffold107228_cov30-Attheya_sp.AAC.1